VPVRASIKILAYIYALLGVAGALFWLYEVFFVGDPTAGILNGPWCLGLAYGLVTFRPWARTLGLVTSGLLGFVGVLILIQGLSVERPVASLFLIALFVAFPAWQWWVLTRPQVRHLFSSKPA
jgi:hypothetical protein